MATIITKMPPIAFRAITQPSVIPHLVFKRDVFTKLVVVDVKSIVGVETRLEVAQVAMVSVVLAQNLPSYRYPPAYPCMKLPPWKKTTTGA